MVSKGIIFYTDNEVSEKIAAAVIDNIKTIAKSRGLPIVCSSLKWKMDFGDENLYFPDLTRSPVSQFKQILAALEHSRSDIIFFCEADVLYHPSHFEFTPPTNDAYYYNVNVWKVWLREGVATRTDINMQLSGLVGDRELMLGHYQRRMDKILQNQADTLARGGVVEREGYSKHMGYEPGGHMQPRGVDEFPPISWRSYWPNLDLRHDKNLTKAKRCPEDYKDKRWAEGWIESKEIPFWGSVDSVARRLV